MRSELNRVSILALLLGSLLTTAPCPSASDGSRRIAVDLHEDGFPSGSQDVPVRVFYLSNDRIALFFDQRISGLSPQEHALKLIVLDVEGHAVAQKVFHADPKALDITAGPGGGLLLGREGELSFYDSSLHLLRSVPLARGTTGIKFDREANQLVVMTVDEESRLRTAHFRDGNSLEESVALSYPIKSWAVFGKNQLVYVVSGDCEGAAHIVSKRAGWSSLDHLPACDPLAFITNTSLAFASNDHLFVADSNGRKQLELRIPTPSTFELPRFVGLSDDHTRLALSALQRKTISTDWPYHDVVFVYDLASKRMLLKYGLRKGSVAEALSPGGHQLATVEDGTLRLVSVP